MEIEIQNVKNEMEQLKKDKITEALKELEKKKKRNIIRKTCNVEINSSWYEKQPIVAN